MSIVKLGGSPMFCVWTSRYVGLISLRKIVRLVNYYKFHNYLYTDFWLKWKSESGNSEIDCRRRIAQLPTDLISYISKFL